VKFKDLSVDICEMIWIHVQPYVGTGVNTVHAEVGGFVPFLEICWIKELREVRLSKEHNKGKCLVGAYMWLHHRSLMTVLNLEDIPQHSVEEVQHIS